nr:isochorismatase family protein [Actinomycetota bacterium]
MIALLVIDVQNAYFEDPALAAQQDTLVAACNELLDAFASNGHKALLVGTGHERDKSTWSLNMLDDDQRFIFRGSDQGQCAYGYGSAVAAAELGRG